MERPAVHGPAFRAAPPAPPESDTQREARLLWPSAQKVIVGLLAVIATLLGLVWQGNQSAMRDLRSDLQAYKHEMSKLLTVQHEVLTQTRIELSAQGGTMLRHERDIDRAQDNRNLIWAAIARVEARLPR